MADRSAIEWTQATWNPVTGCTKVSSGCDHCYAEAFAERFRGVPGHPYEQGFDLRLWRGRLDLPRRWRASRMVFVNSMSDLFHERVPDSYVNLVLDTIRTTPRHTYQVLTKRPGRMAAVMRQLQPTPLSNLWLGASIEDDRYVWRADKLREAPAAVRFLSLEPLLGPLPSLDLADVDWVIVGGESGPRHRPIDPEWVRQLRDRCVDAQVAFFFKQWGGRTPKAVKVGGRWRYVYRAVDQYGQVIDVLVSAGRDQDAARRFFRRALGSTQVIPTEVVTDRAAVYPAVVDELLPEAWHRTDRYANNRAAGSARPWEPRRGLVSSRGAVRSNRRLSREVRPAAFYATVDAADLGDRA